MLTGVQELLADGALTGDWILDPRRSRVELRNKSLGGLARVHGAFREVSGHGTVGPDGRASGTVTVASASVDTRSKRRDTHLRSPDFFDSARHPDITFTADAIRPAPEPPPATNQAPAAGPVTVTGALTVRDQTRPLSFQATADARGDGEVVLDAEIRINRADFGLTWNLLGATSMDNTLTIHAVFTHPPR